MKHTVKGMVKEMFLDATNGRRTAENYPCGMLVIENVGRFYYRAYFEMQYEEWLAGRKSSRQIFLEIARSIRMGSKFAREVSDAIYKIIL